jgi:hypothetical protein
MPRYLATAPAPVLIGVGQRDPVAVGKQQLVEDGRMLGVAKRHRGLREQAQADEPPLVEWHAREPVGREGFESRACLGCVSELRRHLREHAAPDRIRRIVLHRAPNEFFDLLETPLLATKRVELEPVGDGRVPALRVLSHAARDLDQALRLG